MDLTNENMAIDEAFLERDEGEMVMYSIDGRKNYSTRMRMRMRMRMRWERRVGEDIVVYIVYLFYLFVLFVLIS